MEVQDDRNNHEQYFTHKTIVVALDTFLSGWGKAQGGKSYAGWACKSEHVERVRQWVENRSEMKAVRVVDGNYIPSGNGHFHIYVVHDTHPALADK